MRVVHVVVGGVGVSVAARPRCWFSGWHILYILSLYICYVCVCVCTILLWLLPSTLLTHSCWCICRGLAVCCWEVEMSYTDMVHTECGSSSIVRITVYISLLLRRCCGCVGVVIFIGAALSMCVLPVLSLRMSAHLWPAVVSLVVVCVPYCNLMRRECIVSLWLPPVDACVLLHCL